MRRTAVTPFDRVGETSWRILPLAPTLRRELTVLNSGVNGLPNS